ncbi:MAG: FAD/NAD(P)-binding protein [Sphingosinicella sp.]
MSAVHVAIVGAGFAGTAAALHLLAQGAGRVSLIEREHRPGRGIAYGTSRPEHVLNIPARRMVLWPDDREHFARWAEARGIGTPDDYVPRQHFGDYVAEQLAAASERIEIVHGDAIGIDRSGAGERVRLHDGRAIEADAAILAIGNLRPAIPPPLDAERLQDAFVADPWYSDISRDLSAGDTILLVGTGLTAIDAALSLDADGFEGQILALSRRGLIPLPNLETDAFAAQSFPPEPSCVGLLRSARRRAAEVEWRVAVQEVREALHPIWAKLPPGERRRFLRHLRPWWDAHRHRIAPAAARRIAELEAEGRFHGIAGRLLSVERSPTGARIVYRRRGRIEPETADPARIINCTGPELDIARAAEPLLDALLAAGRIIPDACRLGVEVDSHCRTLDREGSPSGLYALGPMTRGAFWESIGVSDIAAHAAGIAERITERATT